jgi:hypothetical protein
MRSKKLLFGIFLLGYVTLSVSLNIKTNKSVNVLSFWGYLDDSRIKNTIESKCKVKFSNDTYYTNEEFLNIFNKSSDSYDIIIFSNLTYGSIKNKIVNNDSKLWKVSYNYHPYFKNYYFSHQYPHNIVFFTHALMGFMYNPNKINISPNQNIYEIFRNAKNNDVILVDDPSEINNLLRLGFKHQISSNKKFSELDYDKLKNVTQHSKIFITNDFNQIYKKENFALAFLWSGDALLYIKNSKKPYKFVLNPYLSFICTDLLAQLRETPEAKCVAEALESPKIMQYVQDSTYYFSPYFINNSDNKNFSILYTQTKEILPKLTWIQPLPNFTKYINKWDDIKLKLFNENK